VTAIRIRALKPCAICGSTTATHVYRHAWFPVVRCNGCGLVYADEKLSEQDLEPVYSGDCYSELYFYTQENIDVKIAADSLHEFRRVDKLVPAGGRLLDFGCARGSFIRMLMESELGSRWRCEGIDINPDEIAMGQAQGMPVRLENLFSTTIPPESYDVITAFAVFDHMHDPRETLRIFRHILKDKGKILVVTTNYDALIFQLGVLAARFSESLFRFFTERVFCKSHFYYFNSRTMNRILNDAGFRTLEMDSVPSYIEAHPPGFAFALGLRGLRLCSRVWGRQTMLLAFAEKV
jgi:2-polyprenyl-3-methyl-5-hydroxy-6-metoxy-1,4-benzoquinol methylase